MCTEDDNTLHTFLGCSGVKLFWNEVREAFKTEFIMTIDLNTVIFGHIQDGEYKEIINFLLLYGKYYLYITKKSNDNKNIRINISQFLKYLKYIVSAEKHCHLLKTKFVKLERIINVINH